MSDQLKYPIGKFEPKLIYSKQEIEQCITEISYLPAQLKTAVRHLNDMQLNTAYRPGGWSLRQVVHHLADSHSNGLIRLKLALTEIEPVIKPYKEAEWAQLSDYEFDVDDSLQQLEFLHKRWTALLQTLPEEAFMRSYFHPEKERLMTLAESTANYAWHGRHHVAHITSLRERKGW